MQYPIGCIITCLLCAHCSNICNICKEYSALSVKTSDNKMNNPIPVCVFLLVAPQLSRILKKYWT